MINGIDDYLGAYGVEASRAVIASAQPFSEILHRPSVTNRIDSPPIVVPRVWTLPELMANRFNTPEPIVENILNEGEMIGLVGKPKTGKTRCAQQLILNAGRGQDFLGMRVPKPRRGLYLDLENRAVGAQFRFGRMMGAPHALDENILLYAPDTLAENRTSLTSPEGFEHLRRMVEFHQPDILIGDVWRLWLGGQDENKAEVVLGALAKLSSLRTINPKLAIIILHHVRKASSDAKFRPSLRVDPAAWIQCVSGSYAFVGHLDACFGLDREVDPDGEERIVFGGQARSSRPPTLLLEEDEETLGFRVAEGCDTIDHLLTEKERVMWCSVSALGTFTYSDVIRRAATTNRKCVASMLRKLQNCGVLEAVAGTRGTYRNICHGRAELKTLEVG